MVVAAAVDVEEGVRVVVGAAAVELEEAMAALDPAPEGAREMAATAGPPVEEVAVTGGPEEAIEVTLPTEVVALAVAVTAEVDEAIVASGGTHPRPE